MSTRPTQEEMKELMSAGDGLYEILGVTPSATKEEIKKQYRMLAKRYHPDKKPSAADQTKFVEINRANKILSDDRMRELYDTYSFDEGGTFHETDGEVREELLRVVELVVAMCSQLVSSPFKMVSVVCQSMTAGGHYRTGWRVASEARRTYGLRRGLFRGTLVGIASVFISDQLAGELQRRIHALVPPSVYKYAAFACQCVVEYPAEMCANIYMVDRHYKGFFDVARHVITRNGFTGLWRVVFWVRPSFHLSNIKGQTRRDKQNSKSKP
ncbi:hypothetical protein DFA_06433 [Cavenderia fasciculata]|uniref:J domain-containing protein n=1 Tax=Cavenderia fasciculata TaxID=261658 RepID=F4PIZ7_CACFS|nr:uncharacterized protein DFA_06433 [Cavenderia fasciculata]EGG24283.1 hypothetical protein DFA_06433 [Cavenderia fasciculata]|eukprot:XP_004362134.1 hypothetical protein DFA_06433 [Cavenderia fasciculata]